MYMKEMLITWPYDFNGYAWIEIHLCELANIICEVI